MPESDAKKTYSRRDFLRLAGVAGATIGVAGGLGGVLAACGSETAETTTTTAAAQETTTTAAGATTTVSASAETGRLVKVGFVTPQTGSLAPFGIPDKYCVERWTEAVGDGLLCGDGQKHPIEIIVRDSQSSASRAAQVAGDLINNDQIDVMVTASTADTVPPVADQCEANGVPCISNDTPWQAYFMGRGGTKDKPFKWTYHFFWGQEDIKVNYFDMWSQFPNNKTYGAMWPNDSDGNAYRKQWPGFLEAEKWKLVDGGAFDNGTEDFTSVISAFKKGGADICAGVAAPPDFTNFWKQAQQQGYKPKAVSVGKALVFPQTLEALGDIGVGLTTVIFWTPTFPFKSSLTGETCQQVADEFEKRSGKQWTQPLFHYAIFEVAVDALKRATSVDDKEAIIAAVATTKIQTLAGDVDFSSPVADGTLHPVQNVYRTPCAGGQWVKGTKYPFDLLITSNADNKAITVQAKTLPLG
jgi:branched-chain amino acid transport system substrate-binding protein